jgi:membrane-bound lytic murein transglycosylase D
MPRFCFISIPLFLLLFLSVSLYAAEASLPNQNQETKQEDDSQTQEQKTGSADNTQNTTEPAQTAGTENAPPAYRQLEVDGADNPLVEKYRKQYQSEFGQKWLTAVLDNGEPYRLYIRRKLAERKMPSLLEYLPVVESSYKITARSKSGATGLWQFMENSTRPFLSRNDFVDERLDPWKSTDAALSKLQENYDMFHDWALAIAAYNCGAGAMAHALKQSPQKDFWYMAEHNLLRDQSVQYVPKLLAIADLVQNSAFYGIEFPIVQDNPDTVELTDIADDFDYISVKKPYSLRQLAAELRIDEDTLLTLNTALVRGITPPGTEYKIRLPAGMEQSAQDALATLRPWGFTMRHIVREGETLWGLARTTNTTVNAICDANEISEKTLLKIGKVLYLPPK